MARGDGLFRFSKDTQKSLVQYAKICLDLHRKRTDWRYKLEFIDIAYARYNALRNNANGVDVIHNSAVDEAGDICCGINQDELVVPIVVSQVDAYVGYLSEVFLSGYPIFPVVSDPDSMDQAEQLQAIIDDHSIRGRYPRQILLGLKDDVKYNFSATEIDWCAQDDYTVLSTIESAKQQGKKLDLTSSSFNKLNHWNVYNTLFDYRVHPVDVPYLGEWAGHIEIVSRVQLIKDLKYYAASGFGYNNNLSLKSKLTADGADNYLGYFREQPQISEIYTKKNWRALGMIDWISYLTGEDATNRRLASMSDIYEKLTLYVRLIPQEHKADNVPNKDVPQVWKLIFINHEELVFAQRVFSIYDTIPVYFTQMIEDNFDLQTQSIAEASIPFQEAASKLFSIRMNGARRAIMDRALYDPGLINSADINAPFPAPKIPVRDNALLMGKTLEQAYRQIPFDSRGTETVISDMGQVVGMADKLQGINQPVQGQFQKGNKTRKEWDDTMQGSANRMRLCALGIEYQKFLPVKEQIKLNIYQYGVSGTFQNQQSGMTYKIDAQTLQAIREKISHFKLADGYTPAEKLASSDVLAQGMQMINQSPVLQQGLGPMLPQIWIHLMSLGGVTGLKQYMPKQTGQSGTGQPTDAVDRTLKSGAPAA